MVKVLLYGHDELLSAMKRGGYQPPDFESYLEAFRAGMPPHRGGCMSLEMITMLLLNLSNIRQAVAFPRDMKRLTP